MPRLNGMMEPFDDTLFPLPDPTPEKPRARAGDRANYTPFNPESCWGLTAASILQARNGFGVIRQCRARPVSGDMYCTGHIRARAAGMLKVHPDAPGV